MLSCKNPISYIPFNNFQVGKDPSVKSEKTLVFIGNVTALLWASQLFLGFSVPICEIRLLSHVPSKVVIFLLLPPVHVSMLSATFLCAWHQEL